jgi:DNA polymerase-3 subunit delta'
VEKPMHSWLIDIKVLLSQQFEENKLPHALLFNGVNGAGKSALAHWLVNILLCQNNTKQTVDSLGSNPNSSPQSNQQSILVPCQSCKSCLLFKSKTFPDHINIDGEGKNIGVDPIRQVSKFFEKKAQLSHNKSAVINQAHSMTTSAANALLKTLEEPNNNNFILLLTSESQTLLPTIISRCYVIDIRPPVGNALLSELKQEHNDPFVNLSHLPELSNGDENKSYQAFSCHFTALIKQESFERSHFLKQLVEDKNSLRWLEKLSIDLMRQNSGWVESTSQLSEHTIWAIYQSIVKTTKTIKQLVQANNQFTFEKLLIDLELIINENRQEN